MFLKKLFLCAILSISTASVYGEEISLEKGVPVSAENFEQPKYVFEQVLFYYVNNVLVELNGGDNHQILHSYPLSSQKNLERLVELALKKKIQKIALVKNGSPERYQVTGLSFVKKPTSIWNFCGDDCQQKLVNDYDFIAFNGPLEAAKTAKVLLTQKDPWQNIAANGFLGAKGLASHCQCYKFINLFFHGYAIVQGEGQTIHEVRSNAMDKCQAKADFVTSDAHLFVQCGYIRPTFD